MKHVNNYKDFNKNKLLPLDLSEYNDELYDERGIEPKHRIPLIKIIERELIDILEEQGFDDEKENWGERYYFEFDGDIYEFSTQDSGKCDDPGCNYSEVEYLKKVS